MTNRNIEDKMNDTSKDDPYEVEKCGKWINERNLNKVCLQFPDNLLPDSVEIALRLENCINKKVYILGDTSYGNCCVDEIAAQHINADSIIHFGHACLNPTTRLPVFHVLPKQDIDTSELISKFKLNFVDQTEKILFFYDIAYAHKIEKICKILNAVYKNLIFTSLNCISNVEFTDVKDDASTIILGRCFKLDKEYKIEDYVAFFLGNGGNTFTRLAMTISAKKWYYFENNSIVEYEILNTPWLKRRRFVVEKLKDARVVGIVVATLGIKDYLKIITMVKNIIKEKKKKSYILSVGKINPTKLANFPEIDAFVVITCPENEIFDSREFLKPLLMPYEVELAFNSSRECYTQYCMDFRQILPGGVNYVDFKPSTDSDVSLITGELRNCDENIPCTDKMNALAINNSSDVVAIGKAGAEFLYNRSWKGVEQRLGKDAVHAAEIGRCGLPSCYENEPISREDNNE
ncbi:2-(3-amino-3-carboxypropyl)histidine synthase subunit 2 isoform X1 [Bombus affinis]|uniref:2-(3-amino-3-carboxypropyl)histidine synthase subunit 2 isoform X1 n=1 Tax=Bombus affinis TaxID=309941 RepID=UPI0021B73323|nr:2-(3-amino-3-carboxypropyl)histidine synthase subunit 2 isoform X1 [Bombus affinis]XP_050573840.1 2-(3-amino-3-carboxypropyl)histidine synthase subunit 2 isoform X1 [Bombus affinis]XP_050573846.1 2-(3-amino-3-carboxypropyl)histidine synthase subunit 2 isoform X1 [Bombus affinis]